jgi:predicted ATPase/DNA-binding SARP family transcriptional activator
MTQTKIFLFGSPRIERDGQPVEIVLRKAVALLAYLVVTKQTHSRESLATLLWPDNDQSTALGNLRRALYRVNRALEGEGLSTTRSTIGYEPEAELWLDTDVFDGHAEACLGEPRGDGALDLICLERLTAAVDLYSSGFMAGFTLPDSPAFDEWQFFQSERLRQSYGRALQQLTQAHRVRGDHREALLFAGRRAAMDPLDESAHRDLMELYARSEQPAAALRQYEQCRQVLDEELGVTPENATTALFSAIKSRRIAAPTPSKEPERSFNSEIEAGLVASAEAVPDRSTEGERRSHEHRQYPSASIPGPRHNLPRCASPFIGRDQELTDVRRLLVGDVDQRLVTITGAGGIGKTRLALEAAHSVIRSFPDGVYFVSLASLVDQEQLLPAVAENVGLRFHQNLPEKQQLFDYLREKRMLLVLDNIEHLLPSAARVVAEILERALSVKIIITSRQRLNLTNEAMYVLSGMAFPEDERCENPKAFAAVRLLEQCARLARPNLNLQTHDLHQMGRICRLVQGMPLAIVLAAGWYELLSFEEIADEIARGLDFLEGQMHDLPERQRSVRAAIEYSWHQLSDADRHAFMCLSVFRHGFTREAARGVTGADLRTLRQLVEKSLVFFLGDGRYAMHELLRQYAMEQLEASGQAERVRGRHSAYYLSLLREREPDVKGGQQLAALDEFDADLENIRVAWTWALHSGDEAAIDGAIESLYLFFTFRSRYREGIEILKYSQEQLTPCPSDALSLVCARLLARLAWLQSMYLPGQEEIERNLHRSLEVAQKHEDRREIAFCLFQMGCYQRLVKREATTAKRYLEQSLRHYRALNDRFYVTLVLHWIGSSYGAAADMAGLIRFCRESLELARQTGNQALIPYNLRALAMGTLSTGDYEATEEYCQQALEIDTEMRLRMGIVESKTLLGLVHFLRGDRDRAQLLAEQSLRMARVIGFSGTLAHAMALKTLVTALVGDPAVSERVGTEGLAQRPTFLGRILLHWALSIASCRLECYDAAWDHVMEALRLAQRLSLPAMMTWPLPIVALILAQRDDTARAAELLSFAYSHPLALNGWTGHWEKLKGLRAQLSDQLGTEAFEAAWTQGTELCLETTVHELLLSCESVHAAA